MRKELFEMYLSEVMKQNELLEQLTDTRETRKQIVEKEKEYRKESGKEIADSEVFTTEQYKEVKRVRKGFEYGCNVARYYHRQHLNKNRGKEEWIDCLNEKCIRFIVLPEEREQLGIDWFLCYLYIKDNQVIAQAFQA
jgi:hypothetical protein